jgi:hypothetical protein
MSIRVIASMVLVVMTSGAVFGQGALTFRKVEFFVQTGDDEDKKDARLVLDPVERAITISDEKNGTEKATYAVIPYDAVTKVIYELSQHRRYGAGLLVNPFLLLSRGKKHWLTVEFQGVESMPQGYIYTRLDKNNYRRILSALRAGLGIEIEEIIQD